MVFSFFKKKESEPAKPPEIKQPRIVQPPRPAGAEPPVAVAEPAATPLESMTLDFTTNFGPTLSGSKIEIVESNDVVSAVMEQAAISYASEQVDDAIAILQADLQTAEGHHALDTWLMLFDLYQIQGKRSEFEELALQFVVEFERSAPVWQQSSSKNKSGKPASAGHAGGPVVLFPPQLVGDAINTPLEQIEKLAPAGQLRLELSRIQAIDSAAAAGWLARLPKFKKAKYQFQAAGGPQLAELLRSKIEVMRRQQDEAPFWLLLLEIYQWLGLQEEFENMAVDYAVTFEVSPPSWDVGSKVKSSAEVAAEQAKLKADAPPATIDAYHFDGVITNASDATFQGLLDYAHAHQDSAELRIDFSAVPRVDFVSCGSLMNVLVNLTAQSRRIDILGANELIVALFRIMGIADVARIIRKK